MQWTHIVPRKARPKCQVCERRARWRCDACFNTVPDEALQGSYFPGMAACDVHREHAEFTETRDLLQAIEGADFQTQERICHYLCRGGLPVVAALAKLLLAERRRFFKAILRVCSVEGDEFARLLACPPKGKSGPVPGFIQGLLRVIEGEQPSIGREALSFLGVFAKHGVPGSIEAVRRCAKNQEATIRDAANRLLDTWDALHRFSEATYPDRRSRRQAY